MEVIPITKDVKTVDISGAKEKEYLKCKIKYLEADSKSENNVELREKINLFKRATKLERTPRGQ
jgi:hypothetical protein